MTPAGGTAEPAGGAAGGTLWVHTQILLGKNLKLKRQQYLIPTRLFGLPIWLTATVEFLLPLGIIIGLTYIKTLTDIDVYAKGWGGDIPQGILDDQTECRNGIEYLWERATRPDENRVTSCRPYVSTVSIAEPFFRYQAQLHALSTVKLALAVDRSTDGPGPPMAFKRS